MGNPIDEARAKQWANDNLSGLGDDAREIGAKIVNWAGDVVAQYIDNERAKEERDIRPATRWHVNAAISGLLHVVAESYAREQANRDKLWEEFGKMVENEGQNRRRHWALNNERMNNLGGKIDALSQFLGVRIVSESVPAAPWRHKVEPVRGRTKTVHVSAEPKSTRKRKAALKAATTRRGKKGGRK